MPDGFIALADPWNLQDPEVPAHRRAGKGGGCDLFEVGVAAKLIRRPFGLEQYKIGGCVRSNRTDLWKSPGVGRLGKGLNCGGDVAIALAACGQATLARWFCFVAPDTTYPIQGVRLAT